MTQVKTAQASEAVRPFEINVPEEELTDLRRRIQATRWPEKETVADFSQGVPLALMQKLAEYWETDAAAFYLTQFFRSRHFSIRRGPLFR